MTYTPKLGIRMIDPTDKFANEAFNLALSDIDNKVLPKSHDTTLTHWDKWAENKTVSVGDIVRITNLPTGLFYKATVAGTTGTIEPTNNVVGSTLTDGTVTWQICELKNGVTNHNDLTGRSVNDTHPMSAITGLDPLLATLASKTDVQTAINNLIDNSPESLNTLKEIADSLNNDPNLYNTLKTLIDKKIDNLSNLEAGIIEYPTLTDKGDGSVLVTGGKYIVYADEDGTMPLTYYEGTSQSLIMTNKTSNFICLHIVNGVPLFFLASRPLINYSNIIIIATVYRFDTVLGILKWGTTGKATAPKLLKRLNRTERFQKESGLGLTESTGRIFDVSSGVVWFSLLALDLSATTSATDETWLLKKVAGQWTSEQVTQYDNNRYNNGTDLATLTTNRYAVNYIFREVSATSKRTFILLGEGDYTLNDALSSPIPEQPMLTQLHCILVGRIIVQKGASTAYAIQSSFDNVFASIGGSASTAGEVLIADSGNYFTGTDVEVALQELGAVKHTHTNKTYLDKIGETSGNLTYNGLPIVGSGGTTTIPDWTPTTAYVQYQPTIYNNILYVALSNHTSSNTFLADMIAGNEKWKAIGASGGSGSSYSQVTKLNANVNDVVEIPITTTTTFNLPPVEVLKFTAGSQNQVLTSCEFNMSDANKFSVDGITNSPYIVFDGNMYLNTDYSFPMIIKAGWTASGQYSEDTNIDDTKFKIIAGVTII